MVVKVAGKRGTRNVEQTTDEHGFSDRRCRSELGLGESSRHANTLRHAARGIAAVVFTFFALAQD
jgi:hypothetical protein